MFILKAATLFGFMIGHGVLGAATYKDEASILEDDVTDEEEGRFLIILPSSSGLNLTTFATVLGPLLALLGTAALLAALGFLLYWVIASKFKSQGSGPTYAIASYGAGTSGYGGSSYRRNDDIDWSALNILDYISMMEEVWRKFDVKDMECQKRLICEIHQNEEDFGGVASNVVSLFKYLRYLTLVKLPGDMQNTFADYLHAADQGRDAKNDCSKVFDTCDFSVKDTYNKYFSKDNKLKK